MIDPVRGAATPLAAEPQTDRTARLQAKARELEAVFLTEMLSHAGLGSSPKSFGGGIGEDQFASFLREQQAKAMVSAGGIGLSERLFRALSETPHGAPGL